MIEVNLLTGLSGAGNSSARFVYEELGYFVMKNIPNDLADNLFLSLINNNNPVSNKYCLMVNLNDAKYFINASKKYTDKIKFQLVVLTAAKDEILKRYVLTRHAHPRAIIENIDLEKAIDEEINDVNDLVDIADLFIDTTNMSVKTLHLLLHKKLNRNEKDDITSLTFMSYGLKNGIPQGLDCSFDVRILPNPYWIDNLKDKTGADKEVIDYLRSFPITQKVLDNIINYLSFYIKELQKEGRSNYLIGISCSGGQHRSTYIANELASYFKNEYKVAVIHRDSPDINNG